MHERIPPDTLREAGEIVRGWRWRIVVVAFLLPFVASFSIFVTSYFPDSWISQGYYDSWDKPPPPIPREEALQSVFWLPILYVPFANWPFFVLAACVPHYILKLWPNRTAVRVSMSIRLGGMMLPYLLGYWMVPLDFGGGGIGVAYFLVFVCPIVGWLFSILGGAAATLLAV